MRFLFFIMTIMPCVLFSQHQSVFPQLSGNQLLEALKFTYKPTTTLGYNDARDTLFLNILAVNNLLSCLYTDYTITLNGSDPSEDAFNKGINTEHIVPQSKGADNEPARSNMYNLYPTRENVNNDRGNLPLGEVPDHTTKWWYYQDKKQSNRPANNIDNYSELGNTHFEPKESRKGDIARAIFYFYTVYDNETRAADPNYLQLMVEDLCQWHYEDVVDSDEWNRNQMIGIYQEDKVNPFVLDCTLPERSFCAGMDFQCTPVIATHRSDLPLEPLSIYPNPAILPSYATIETTPTVHNLMVLNQLGQQVANYEASGSIRTEIYLESLMPGVYYVFGKNVSGYIVSSGRLIVQ